MAIENQNNFDTVKKDTSLGENNSIKKMLNNKDTILNTIKSNRGEESDDYKRAIEIYTKIEDQIPDTKLELNSLSLELSYIQKKEYSLGKVSFAYGEKDPSKMNEQTKKQVIENYQEFINSDGDINKLSTNQVGWLLSNIYIIHKEFKLSGYLEKFKEKLSDNPNNLKFIADHWNKGAHPISTQLQYNASIIGKEIIKDCISGAGKAIDKEINNFISKLDVSKEEKEILNKEIKEILVKSEKSGNPDDLKNIALLLDNMKVCSGKDALAFTSRLTDRKLAEIKLKKVENDEEIEKLRISNPDLYNTLKKLKALKDQYRVEKKKENKFKITRLELELKELLEDKDIVKANPGIQETITNSIAYTDFEEKAENTKKILDTYSKNEKSAEIFLTAIKSNDSINLSTIDKAIKEQKIDLKTGEIEKKFLDENGEIDTDFTKEDFREIKSDTSGFLVDLPVGTEMPVGQTSNIIKKEDGTYDIQIIDKITGLLKYNTEYKNLDKGKAEEIMKYINLFDEIGLSYLTPQLLKSGDDTLLKKIGIVLDGKTSVSGNQEEKILLQKISKIFFPEEQLRSDIFDLKYLFKSKLMEQGFMGIGFRGFAVNNYNKDKEKSIFDENGMINPLKITTSI